MFSDTFTFGGAVGGSNSDPFNFTASQETFFASQNIEDGTSKGLRELEAGVLPYTIAGCIRANDSKAFDGGRCHILGQQWQAVMIVGFLITLTEEDEGDIWSGIINDGTGSIPFRYENRTSNFGDGYANDMDKIRPIKLDENKENYSGSIQFPVRIIGQPQEINEQLQLMISFMRPADPLDYAATLFLECAAVYLQLQKIGASVEAGDSTCDLGQKRKNNGSSAKDPYNDEPIKIDNEDIAACIGSDRLKAVIYKYLTESVGGGLPNRGDKSTLAASIRGFCSCRWQGTEVNGALDQLDEAGVIIYTDDSKNRVMLIGAD